MDSVFGLKVESAAVPVPARCSRTAAKVFFSADDGVTGTELWAIPGSALAVRGGHSARPTRTLPFRP